MAFQGCTPFQKFIIVLIIYFLNLQENTDTAYPKASISPSLSTGTERIIQFESVSGQIPADLTAVN